MPPKRNNRIVWVLVALLAGLVLVGVGVLIVRLKPYWVAKYRGEGADLHGAVLPYARLHFAFLEYADLRDANLRGADLTGAFLGGAQLQGADLRGANLKGVSLVPMWQEGHWVIPPRTRYDDRTRWPDSFDPRAHGAILMK
jgi:Pentapeptide repeats (8 copies)